MVSRLKGLSGDQNPMKPLSLASHQENTRKHVGKGKEKKMFTFKKAFTEEVKVSRAEEVLKGAVQHMAGIEPEDEE